MLEAIRERAQTWLAKLILALITIPFALWGIDSYIHRGGSEPPVATVSGDEITVRDFSRALKDQRDMIEQQGGAKVDVEDKDFREGVLKQIINTRLLSTTALRNGMVVPAGEIETMIRSAPAFQQDGKFSQPAFEAWLRNREIGEGELLRMINEDALSRQLQFAYGEGAILSSTVTTRLANLLAQQREVNELVFDAAAFIKGVSIDEQAVNAEYKARQSDFVIPEQVRLQYLVLSTDAISERVKVSDETAKQYYEANIARYQEPEQRRASHIMIKADAAMTAADRQAAKASADKLFNEVSANPGRFADLARQHSQDPGSAAKGGDLGSFTRDTMVKAFSDAVFSMKVGEIRGPVESEFGYHIIRLDGVAPGARTAFEKVRQEIIHDLSQQEAQRKFAELAERFGNMVYEQPETLDPAAREFQLPIQESGWISRNRAEPAFLANRQLLDAVFAPEAREKRQNTEAIEVSPGVLLAARVIEYKPAGTQPLAEVADTIRQMLLGKAARAKAIEAGLQALKAVQAGQSVAGLSAPILVNRSRTMNLPAESVKAIFSADAGKLPAGVGVETAQGYRVYRINKVEKQEANAERTRLIQRDLSRLQAQAELKAYLEYVRATAEVEIDQKRIENRKE